MAFASTETELASSVQGNRIASGESSTLLGLLPGIALLAVVGYAGKFVRAFPYHLYQGPSHHVSRYRIRALGDCLWDCDRQHDRPAAHFPCGVATYEFWLKAGIILLGARFILGDILRLGGISLVLVLIALTLSLSFMTWLGRTFHLGPQLTTLLAVGSSICGVSAIIATQGAIDASEEDSSTAIAAILALGALSLLPSPSSGTRCTCPTGPTACGRDLRWTIRPRPRCRRALLRCRG